MMENSSDDQGNTRSASLRAKPVGQPSRITWHDQIEKLSEMLDNASSAGSASLEVALMPEIGPRTYWDRLSNIAMAGRKRWYCFFAILLATSAIAVTLFALFAPSEVSILEIALATSSRILGNVLNFGKRAGTTVGGEYIVKLEMSEYIAQMHNELRSCNTKKLGNNKPIHELLLALKENGERMISIINWSQSLPRNMEKKSLHLDSQTLLEKRSMQSELHELIAGANNATEALVQLFERDLREGYRPYLDMQTIHAAMHDTMFVYRRQLRMSLLRCRRDQPPPDSVYCQHDLDGYINASLKLDHNEKSVLNHWGVQFSTKVRGQYIPRAQEIHRKYARAISLCENVSDWAATAAEEILAILKKRGHSEDFSICSLWTSRCLNAADTKRLEQILKELRTLGDGTTKDQSVLLKDQTQRASLYLDELSALRLEDTLKDHSLKLEAYLQELAQDPRAHHHDVEIKSCVEWFQGILQSIARVRLTRDMEGICTGDIDD